MTTRKPLPSVQVGVSILVIPHGVASNGDMLLGLQLTPVPDSSGGASKARPVDLAIWPEEFRARLSSLTVHLGELDKTTGD